ncbi:MAG TPA: hypothetical protein VNQ79_06810 [Blastocatellia bacterium]|nr:hypothetical protein [Blastocatellia bacterium]
MTIAGGFQQGAAGLRIESRSGKPHSGKPYFRPDAEVILLIGSERITLPKSEKSFPLAADGSYQGESFVTVPADVFCRLAESESWSMMIGDVIVGLGDKDVVSDKSEKVAKHWRSRVQPRLIELKKLIESHNAMVRN